VYVFQICHFRVASFLGGVTACACSGNSGDGGRATSVTQEVVLKNYAANLYAAYSDSVIDVQNLKIALQTLVSTPTDANLTAARDAWWASREHYMLTEGARFYDGPIVAATGG